MYGYNNVSLYIWIDTYFVKYGNMVTQNIIHGVAML